MANFHLRLSSSEILRIISEHVSQRYNLDSKVDLVIEWLGGVPIGIDITHSDIELPKGPRHDPFA